MPPTNFPAPPEPRISRFSTINNGAMDSSTSTGVFEALAGKLIALMPSLLARAPCPPLYCTVSVNGRPSCTPSKRTGQIGELPESAWMRSEQTGASAANTSEGSRLPTMCRANVGAGHAGFRMLPSGAVIWMGRAQPALFGVSGSRTHFRP